MPRKKKEEAESKSPVKDSAKPKAAAKPKVIKAAKAARIPKAAKESKASKEPRAPLPAKAKMEKAPKTPKSSQPPVPTSPLKKLQRKGETQMVAFIRDPQCLFTYWEVTPESIQSVKQLLQEEFVGSSMVLRVFRRDPEGKVELIQEIFVEPKEMNRYIAITDPRGSYFLEIAQKGSSGKIAVFARSNELSAGPSGFAGSAWAPSASDLQWETPTGLMEYFSQEEYTETFLTPGGISSADSLKRKLGRFASSNIK